jgi:hypothetical protein
MCIMAIHATASTANALQAMAHNADTLVRDLKQLEKLLSAREDYYTAVAVDSEVSRMNEIAQSMWSMWRDRVGPDAIPHGSMTSTGYEADRKMDRVARDES